MNFTYDELSKLKYAASKLLECAHQIEAVNITTGVNFIKQSILILCLMKLTRQAKQSCRLLQSMEMIMRNLFPLILIVLAINVVLTFMLYSVS